MNPGVFTEHETLVTPQKCILLRVSPGIPTWEKIAAIFCSCVRKDSVQPCSPRDLRSAFIHRLSVMTLICYASHLGRGAVKSLHCGVLEQEKQF